MPCVTLDRGDCRVEKELADSWIAPSSAHWHASVVQRAKHGFEPVDPGRQRQSPGVELPPCTPHFGKSPSTKIGKFGDRSCKTLRVFWGAHDTGPRAFNQVRCIPQYSHQNRLARLKIGLRFRGDRD